MGLTIQQANAEGVPVDDGQSLQAMIELVYVQSANDVLYNNLQSLQSYLGTTQNTMNVLTQLQNLHNEITVDPVGNFSSGYWTAYTYASTISLRNGTGGPAPFTAANFQGGISPGGVTFVTQQLLDSPVTVNGTTYQFQGLPASGTIVPAGTYTATITERKWVPASTYITGAGGEGPYETAMSAYFGNPTNISASFGSGGFNAFSQQMLQLKAEISTQLIPGLSASQVRLPVPAGSPPGTLGATDPQSLLGQMRLVLKNLDGTNFTNIQSSVAWLTDNYNTLTTAASGSQGGQTQQLITNAITAAESLNTTQTESVRNYLYLFEEYYKSATSILQQMTQLIQKMADNIA